MAPLRQGKAYHVNTVLIHDPGLTDLTAQSDYEKRQDHP